jgi:hypothetical protein
MFRKFFNTTPPGTNEEFHEKVMTLACETAQADFAKSGKSRKYRFEPMHAMVASMIAVALLIGIGSIGLHLDWYGLAAQPSQGGVSSEQGGFAPDETPDETGSDAVSFRPRFTIPFNSDGTTDSCYALPTHSTYDIPTDLNGLGDSPTFDDPTHESLSLFGVNCTVCNKPINWGWSSQFYCYYGPEKCFTNFYTITRVVFGNGVWVNNDGSGQEITVPLWEGMPYIPETPTDSDTDVNSLDFSDFPPDIAELFVRYIPNPEIEVVIAEFYNWIVTFDEQARAIKYYTKGYTDFATILFDLSGAPLNADSVIIKNPLFKFEYNPSVASNPHFNDNTGRFLFSDFHGSAPAGTLVFAQPFDGDASVLEVRIIESAVDNRYYSAWQGTISFCPRNMIRTHDGTCPTGGCRTNANGNCRCLVITATPDDA